MSGTAQRLRWSIGLPKPGVATASPDTLAAIARAIESAGFDGVWVSDHPFPVDMSAPVETGPGGARKLGAGHQDWDPFVSLAWLGALTQRLMLHANAVVLPYRSPFVVAKAAATVQHLSRGRLILSIAAGYLKAEFDALGVDIGARTELTEEGVTALRAAWRGEPLWMSSPHWKVEGNAALPAPDPQPPLWRAGNSRTAIAHAARAFDGWTPFEVTAEDARATHTAPLDARTGLAGKIALFRQLCAEVGRPQTLDVSLVRTNWNSWITRSRQDIRDELSNLQEMGVTWIVTSVATADGDEFARRLETIHNIVS